MNAWILTGNVLNVLLNGALGHRVDQFDHAQVQYLNHLLCKAQPGQLLGVLQQLSPENRALLRQACERAYEVAGTEAEAVLGLDRVTAQPVLDYLQDPDRAPYSKAV